VLAVEADRVWKYFGDYPALRGADLKVEKGSCLALLGRNGAGKTTFLRILANLSRPTKGEIRCSVGKNGIGYLGHGIGVYDDLSAMENLLLFGELMSVADPKKAAMEALDRVGLGRVKDGLAREFSRGMRQRLAVARAFIHDPSVLLLDEPFTALDDRAVAVLQDLMRQALAAGKTVVMSTHQLREALELASHVALLVRGQVAFEGECTSEMVEDPGYVYARYGEG